LGIKFAGLMETLNKTNSVIAYRKISGANIPVMTKEITNKAHFDSQIYPTFKAIS
tara:strand:+ start:107 stop:271 length:165 start_codon:yes stop_codon:yes gene_type:complete